MPRDNLRALAKRVDARLIEQLPKGGKLLDYVPHGSITELLLYHIGPFHQSVSQVLKDADGLVDGVVLSCSFEVDSVWVTIEEVGEPQSGRNYASQGEKLKDCVSDALKRCAMRIGLGLHLWSGDKYVLDKALERDANEARY